MSYQLLTTEDHKARKPHKCIWCGEQILPGTWYTKQRGVMDGEMQVNKWHKECLVFAADECADECEWEFSPYENERPPAASQEGKQK